MIDWLIGSIFIFLDKKIQFKQRMEEKLLFHISSQVTGETQNLPVPQRWGFSQTCTRLSDPQTHLGEILSQKLVRTKSWLPRRRMFCFPCSDTFTLNYIWKEIQNQIEIEPIPSKVNFKLKALEQAIEQPGEYLEKKTKLFLSAWKKVAAKWKALRRKCSLHSLSL